MPKKSNLGWSDTQCLLYGYERHYVAIVLGVLNHGLSQARSAQYEPLKQDPSELQLRVSHEVTRMKFPHPIVDCVVKLQRQSG